MLGNLSDENNPAHWFELAADRLKVADLAWKHEGLTAAGIELLQESAERYLTGYLIAKGWRLIKTHDWTNSWLKRRVTTLDLVVSIPSQRS